MDIILSLYPKNISKIESGVKKYEFRRNIYKNTNVRYAFVYACAPQKKIVSYFRINSVISGTPEEIWNICGKNSGSTKESLFNYFKGKKIVYALEISDYNKFSNPLNPYDYIENFYPPQSFRYLDNGFKTFLLD